MLHGVEWLGRQYNALSKGAAANQSLVLTINTLATRLGEANKTENPNQERRAAILTLKGLAKDHAKEVSAHAGKALLDCLVIDIAANVADAARDDVARSLIDCLLAVCTPPEPPAQAGRKPAKPQPPVISPTLEQFLETSAPLHALLPLLAPNRTFYLRFSALQFLALLLRHRKTLVQSHVLTSPGGCGAVLECLSTKSPTGQSLGSSAEIIRNEALLLLPHLVDANADIQKLIAFEGAFEKLLDVVAQEGRIEGGVVVQDALEALEALLRYNVSNQNYFRETLSIPLLAPLLFYPPPLPPNAPVHVATQRNEELERFAFQPWEYDASEDFGAQSDEGGGPNIVGDSQKLINAQLVVGIAGLLVQGSGEARRANQNALLSTGFFHALLDLSLGSSAPVPLKTQALQVLSLLLKQSRTVQDALGEAAIAPVEPIKTQLASEMNEQAAPETANPLDAEKAAGASNQPTKTPAVQMIEFARLPHQPALLALISAALDGIPPPHRPIDGGKRCVLGFRAAGVKTLQSILSDNIDARLYVVASMASSENSQDQEQPGAVLLDALTRLPANGQAEGFDEHRALFAGMILGSVIKGAESVKGLATRLRYGADGKLNLLPEGADARAAQASANDDDDDNASLLSVLVGNITIALRSQSDALRAERSQAAGAASIEGPNSASWTRILLAHLTVLALWLHASPASVANLVSDSSNLQAVVQVVAEGANGEHLVVGVATWVLGTIYEWGPPAPSEGGKEDGLITRREIHDVATSRIGADQYQAKLQRLRDDPRLKLVGPDALDKIAYRPDPISAALTAGRGGDAPAESVTAHLGLHRGETSGDAGTNAGAAGNKKEEEELPEVFFDWNFAEFWRHEEATITHTILVPPETTSAAAASTPAELIDARSQIERLRDEVQRLAHEVEVRGRLITESEQSSKAAEEERAQLARQIEELKTAGSGHEGVLADLRKSHETELDSLRSNHSTELDKLRSELNSSQSEVARAGESSSSALAASQERVLSVESLLNEHKEKSQASEEQVRVLQEQLATLSSKLDESEKGKKTNDEELERVKRELEEAKASSAPAQNDSAAESKPSGGGGGDDAASKERLTELEQENQDLLVMLDELSTKRKRDKAKLKEKGEEVSDDDDDDDDDDE